MQRTTDKCTSKLLTQSHSNDISCSKKTLTSIIESFQVGHLRRKRKQAYFLTHGRRCLKCISDHCDSVQSNVELPRFKRSSHLSPLAPPTNSKVRQLTSTTFLPAWRGIGRALFKHGGSWKVCPGWNRCDKQSLTLFTIPGICWTRSGLYSALRRSKANSLANLS